MPLPGTELHTAMHLTDPLPFVFLSVDSGHFYMPIDNVFGTFRHQSDSGISMT